MANGSEAGAWIQAAVTKYEGPLTAYAARLLGGDVDRARDVVQDTFLKLWTTDAALVDGHLAAWLYRVCRNAALDVRRKEVRMTLLQDDRRIEAPAESRGVDAPLGSIRGAEAAEGLFAMLEKLPERQQEILRLKFQGGLSYSEIATVMDLTVSHVGVLIHTAIKAIRERLGPAEPSVRAALARIPAQGE